MSFELVQKLSTTVLGGGGLQPGRLDGSLDKGRDVVFDLISVELVQLWRVPEIRPP